MNYPEFEKFDLNKKEPSIATPDTINSAMTPQDYWKDAIFHVDGAEYNVDEQKLTEAFHRFADVKDTPTDTTTLEAALLIVQRYQKAMEQGRLLPEVEPKEEESQEELWMDVMVESHAIEKIGVSKVIQKVKQHFRIERIKDIREVDSMKVI
jgi:hypothetical protein